MGTRPRQTPNWIFYTASIEALFNSLICCGTASAICHLDSRCIRLGFDIDSTWIRNGFDLDPIRIRHGFDVRSTWVRRGFELDSTWIRPRFDLDSVCSTWIRNKMLFYNKSAVPVEFKSNPGRIQVESMSNPRRTHVEPMSNPNRIQVASKNLLSCFVYSGCMVAPRSV